ncbi:MAG: TatD family hydrolase [Deltaproteobacteria bacterium]|nr:TatD family hydrolase [Deltaproteobacteria bacterium]
MKLFDSHCHLNDASFTKDMDSVFSRAKEAGVDSIMIVGIDADSSAQAVKMAHAHSGCYASVGVHPHDAKACTNEIIDRLTSLAKDPAVAAWGETGLDFNRMYSPRDVQEKWFVRQIEAAASLDLPLIFHERDSSGRFLELLRAHLPKGHKGVVHCFSGTKEELAAYLDLSLYIGITGVVTHKQRGEGLRELVRGIPEDRIVIETDAPYLTPSPERNRHRRNEPAFVRTVLMKLSEIRQQDPEIIAPVIRENTCRLFGLVDGSNRRDKGRI